MDEAFVYPFSSECLNLSSAPICKVVDHGLVLQAFAFKGPLMQTGNVQKSSILEVSLSLEK